MEQAPRAIEHRAYLMLVATTFFWSLNYPFVRWFRDDAPPTMMAFWRWAIALAIFLPFAWKPIRAELPKIRANWRQLLVLGACSCSLNSLLAYIGIQATTVANASLLNAMTPIFTILLAVPLARERLAPGRLVGVFVSFLGVIWIVLRGELATLSGLALNIGDFAIVAACAVWGIYTNLLRRWSLHLTPFASLATMMVAGVLVMSPMYALEIAFARPTHWNPSLIAGLFVIGVFSSLLANLFWNRSVMTVGAGRAAAFTYLLPVFSITIAIAFLGERLHPYHWIGASLIFMGIAIANRAR